MFLRHIQDARITVFLPRATEGFFLPALEGMALGTIVVCPDCIGNRSCCLPGHNDFRPNFVIDDVARFAEAALTLLPSQKWQLDENSPRTSDGHSCAHELEHFWLS